MKKHNFYAGPAILPDTAVQNTANAILDFNGTSLSLMEISHRSQEFKVVIEEAQSLFKELLNVPDDYSVLLAEVFGDVEVVASYRKRKGTCRNHASI